MYLISCHRERNGIYLFISRQYQTKNRTQVWFSSMEVCRPLSCILSPQNVGNNMKFFGIMERNIWRLKEKWKNEKTRTKTIANGIRSYLFQPLQACKCVWMMHKHLKNTHKSIFKLLAQLDASSRQNNLLWHIKWQ